MFFTFDDQFIENLARVQIKTSSDAFFTFCDV